MLGINYESSDEEEPVLPKQFEVGHVNAPHEDAIATNIKLPKSTPATNAPVTTNPSAPETNTSLPDSIDGPSQGPSIPQDQDQDDTVEDAPPGSPYTSSRLTIQNLTLPVIPNWNIPPSPPGSPPQKATKKFTQFLELKKKGQHFNSRLETSSVLRDPNHLQKLNSFAGIEESDQYNSVLPDEVGVPAIWPVWAYGDELNATQKKMRGNAPRGPPAFAPAKSGSADTKSTLSVRAAQEGTQNSRKRKGVD
ncbi:unnamed protein product [Periconia digitata]|uniref:Uncharacterized protein n=1 Tax=Periconia digitata TaxID=1303443 RepID=A0A9W4UTW3_9PLEO|nr:unnamed protein product [Periconia digitata]